MRCPSQFPADYFEICYHCRQIQAGVDFALLSGGYIAKMLQLLLLVSLVSAVEIHHEP